MASALQRFYKDDSETSSRELTIFRACNEKVAKILRWSQNENGSLEELRALALSRGGLFNASMRQSAWLALLGVVDLEEARILIRRNLRQETDQEGELIRQDVGRSALFRYQAVTGTLVKGEQQSETLKEKLASVLNAAVSRPLSESNDKPAYYQGLHDVASVFLFNLNYNEVKTAAVMRRMVETHLQDAVKKDFANVTILLDCVLMPYLYSLDPEVYQAIVESEVPITSAVMPWLITLFTHDVHDTAVVSRLMDAFVASHPALPFYMALALLVHPDLRHQLLEAAFDPGMMHRALQGLPKQMKNDFTTQFVGKEVVVTAQDVIDSSLRLMRETPPEDLLQFVGVGCKPRTRQHLVSKVRDVATLDLPAEQSTLFHRCKIPATQLYTSTMVYFRAIWNILQVVVLFLLMPHLYMGEFMKMMRSISRSKAPSNKNAKLSCSNSNGDSYDDDSMPGMMKSSSALSLTDMMETSGRTS